MGSAMWTGREQAVKRVLLLFQNLALLALLANGMLGGGVNYHTLQKRLMIYKILKVFEEN